MARGYSLVSIRLSDIASMIGCSYIGHDILIDGFNLSNRKTLSQSILSYCTSYKYIQFAQENQAVKALIINEEIYSQIPDNEKSRFSYILYHRPEPAFYKLFTEVARKYSKKKIRASELCGVNVMKGAVIEDGVIIGNNVIVGYNSVIKSGTIIGDNVIIGSCSVIGGEGYQLIKDEDGNNMTIPHIGGVNIHDNVTIGDNTTISRALFEGYTEIGSYTKISNQVQIAHNCVIGKNCAIISNAVLYGSCEIQDNVWIAPSASIMNRVVVGKNAFIGAATLVNKDVPEGWTMIGIPARRLNKKV